MTAPVPTEYQRGMRTDWLELAREEVRRAITKLGLAASRAPEVVWNSDLRTIAGRYLGRANLIELNPAYCLRFGLAEVVATVRHETCHMGLRRGTALKHRDPLFRDRMTVLSAPGHCLSMPADETRASRLRYRYRCPACRRPTVYRRKVGGYACRACCQRHSGGRYDSRFRLRLVSVEQARRRKNASRARYVPAGQLPLALSER